MLAVGAWSEEIPRSAAAADGDDIVRTHGDTTMDLSDGRDCEMYDVKEEVQAGGF